jgi:hypothetical protein
MYNARRKHKFDIYIPFEMKPIFYLKLKSYFISE